MAEIKLKIASVVIGSGEGGGSGVASYYADLPDKPSINGETLSGDMTSEDLGLASSEQSVPAGGTAGQVLAKKSNADNDVQWVNQQSGGQGTTDYTDLDNKPQINSVVLSGNKSASDLGLATASQGAKADTAMQQVTVGTTTTGAAGTNASVTNSGTTTNPILDFTIPRGADGQDAVNPFKGWFDAVITGEAGSKVITSETANLPANPVVGDFAYVKTLDITGTAPSQTETPIVKIYECNTVGSWTDSGREFNPLYVQSFATGEQVNEVGIDRKPTAGSNNLVMSGGIYEAIKEKAIVEESGIFFTDPNFNVGAKYDEDGLDIAKVSSHFVQVLKSAGVGRDNVMYNYATEVEEDGFFFVDTDLNIGVKIDSNGIQAKNILEYEIIEN